MSFLSSARFFRGWLWILSLSAQGLAQPYDSFAGYRTYILPRNLTLINSSDRPLLHLYEWGATARCFSDAGVNSTFFQLCFTNTTPSAYTFSILTFDNTYDSDAHQFVHAAQSRVVWSANRQHLVTDGSALQFQSDGDLTLRDSNGSLVWSSGTANAGVAGLSLDDFGNLVVFNALNGTLWQSFDYPTDVLLQAQYLHPGMSLISRASDSDPSLGMFSLTMEIGGLAAYYNHSQSSLMPYWAFSCYGLNDYSSVLKTCNTQYSLLVDGTNTPVLDFINYTDKPIPQASKSPQLCKFNTSACGNFLRYFIPSIEISSLVSFIRMESNGSVQAYAYYYSGWLINDTTLIGDYPCLPDTCGSFGVCSSSGSCSCPGYNPTNTDPIDSFQPLPSASSQFTGCSPPRNLSCPPSTNVTSSVNVHQHFLNLSSTDYFPNLYAPPQNYTKLEDCLNTCLYDCSCLAAFYHNNTGSCFLTTGDVATLISVGTETSHSLAFLKVENAPSSHSNTSARVIAGTIVGTVICLFLMVAGVWGYRHCSLEKITDWMNGEVDDEQDDEDSFLNTLPTLPQRYSFQDLQSITGGFCKQLGAGGFGKVYEGILQNGAKVAVKNLESAKQGKKEFRAEIAIMGSIHHVNLARLCGFCAEHSHRLLLYEYQSNGSLDRWLFQPSDNVLDWHFRFQIAVGTARGLAYLHEECAWRIIHLDIKPQNILLDENFIAKVSDFGLSRLVTQEERSAAVQTTMRGTPGYLAPEWLVEGAITEKADVYSFGMVLLEIISGRKNLDYSAPSDKIFYPAWALSKVADEGITAALMDLPDQRLKMGSKDEQQQVERMILVALLCIQEDPFLRPSMISIVQMLEGIQGVDFVTTVQPYRVSKAVEFSVKTQTRLASEGHFHCGGMVSSMSLKVGR